LRLSSSTTSRVGPRAVDLVALDENIRTRERDTGADEECLKELLEVTPYDVHAALRVFNDSSEGGASRLARIALEEVAEPQPIGEPQLLGLPHRAAELVALKDSTEVEQRARHRGGRDAVVGGDLVGGEVGVVDADALAGRPSPARHGHFEPAASPDAPQRGRGEVAQYGAPS